MNDWDTFVVSPALSAHTLSSIGRLTSVPASVNVACIPLLSLLPRACAPTIRPRPRHATYPLGESRASVVLQAPSSKHKPPNRSHDRHAKTTPTARTQAKPVEYRERVPCRCDGSKVERMTDLCVYSSHLLPDCSLAFFFLLSVSYPVSRSSCSPCHSCIPRHVMIIRFIFHQRLYIHTHVSYNIIRCILSSHLLSLPAHPNRRNARNRSTTYARGMKKIATSGRIWQSMAKVRDRFEDLPVSPNHPPPQMSAIHDLAVRHRCRRASSHCAGRNEEEGGSLHLRRVCKSPHTTLMDRDAVCRSSSRTRHQHLPFPVLPPWKTVYKTL